MNRTNPERSSLCYFLHPLVLPITSVQPLPSTSGYWTPSSVRDQDVQRKRTYN